jgi:hypothetical protein
MKGENMRWKRSLEHLERRVDRYYRLAAAAKLPDIRERYIELARRYRLLWAETLAIRGVQAVA